MTQGKPSIRVENYIDLDEPPLNFTYINECKVSQVPRCQTDLFSSLELPLSSQVSFVDFQVDSEVNLEVGLNSR